MDRPDDLLEEVAVAMAGDFGCCGWPDKNGRCCMTDQARHIISVIERFLGTSIDPHAKRA